eukprot:360975_1
MTEMNLYVVAPNRRTTLISIQHNATIQFLKTVICNKLQLNTLDTEIRISIKDLKPLVKESLSLTDYGITNNSSICVTSITSVTITIYVDVCGKRHWLNGIKLTDTIQRIKQYLQIKLSIPIKYQTLKFNDIKLTNNDDTLHMSNISRRSTLKLILPTELQIFTEVLSDKLVSIIHINDDYNISNDYNIENVNKLFLDTMTHKIDNISMFKIEKNSDINLKIYNNILSLMDNKNEDILFHGTSFKNIINIVHNGFNRDYNTTSVFGKGTYFAKSSTLAADYSIKSGAIRDNYYAILCCKVIIGEYTAGKIFMNDKQLWNSNGKQYDSLVNNIYKPTIFVINRDYHAIPQYIILFKYSRMDYDNY